ncbi:hypothetical protein ACFQ9X_50110 [Catenulispora yoronensis]
MADQTSIRLRALTDLARALARVHGFSEVITVAAEESRQALEARVVSLSEFVRATGQLRVLINHGDLRPFEERYPEEEWYAPSDFPRIVSEEYPGRGRSRATTPRPPAAPPRSSSASGTAP